MASSSRPGAFFDATLWDDALLLLARAFGDVLDDRYLDLDLALEAAASVSATVHLNLRPPHECNQVLVSLDTALRDPAFLSRTP